MWKKDKDNGVVCLTEDYNGLCIGEQPSQTSTASPQEQFVLKVAGSTSSTQAVNLI